MAYRNGTYVAFHANGTNYPIHSDIKYYNMIKAWSEKSDDEFTIINSHDKTAAVRDSSSKETLRNRLKERLRNSKNLVLIIGETTKFDDDWVPFEIEYAVDVCKIPLIVTYVGIELGIQNASDLSAKWPPSLKKRIDEGTAHAIHIPFRKTPIYSAVRQFNHNNLPNGYGLGIYSRETYKMWNIAI
ncbi:TIR domain-containing protein [Chitinophaga defluvii]|uniref:TIR domain-containing protein n=1 Tax=Chitinophaga defluvii TaxID=3163343 RepID=A0ABV2TCI3_9BACT